MNKAKELVERLSYLEYPIKIKEEDIEFAKVNGLVIVSGASDDLCYLEGAICEEVGCFDGGALFFKNGELISHDVDFLCEKETDSFVRLQINWCDPNELFTWTYKFDQDIPVEKFGVYDGEEAYCEGIVFRAGYLLNK